jgi:hypothetical protein
MMPLRLRGPLDCIALESALGDLVERHESMRTLFPEIEGTPHQLILEPANARPKLRVRFATEDTLAEALSAAAHQSFDLGFFVTATDPARQSAAWSYWLPRNGSRSWSSGTTPAVQCRIQPCPLCSKPRSDATALSLIACFGCSQLTVAAFDICLQA